MEHYYFGVRINEKGENEISYFEDDFTDEQAKKMIDNVLIYNGIISKDKHTVTHKISDIEAENKFFAEYVVGFSSNGYDNGYDIHDVIANPISTPMLTRNYFNELYQDYNALSSDELNQIKQNGGTNCYSVHYVVNSRYYNSNLLVEVAHGLEKKLDECEAAINKFYALMLRLYECGLFRYMTRAVGSIEHEITCSRKSIVGARNLLEYILYPQFDIAEHEEARPANLETVRECIINAYKYLAKGKAKFYNKLVKKRRNATSESEELNDIYNCIADIGRLCELNKIQQIFHDKLIPLDESYDGTLDFIKQWYKSFMQQNQSDLPDSVDYNARLERCKTIEETTTFFDRLKKDIKSVRSGQSREFLKAQIQKRGLKIDPNTGTIIGIMPKGKLLDKHNIPTNVDRNIFK